MFSWNVFQIFAETFCYHCGGSSNYWYNLIFQFPLSLYLYINSCVLASCLFHFARYLLCGYCHIVVVVVTLFLQFKFKWCRVVISTVFTGHNRKVFATMWWNISHFTVSLQSRKVRCPFLSWIHRVDSEILHCGSRHMRPWAEIFLSTFISHKWYIEFGSNKYGYDPH
jgi:hypothetical protein